MGLKRKAASGEIKSAWMQDSATWCVWKHKGQMGQTSPDLLRDYKGSSANQYYLFPLTSWAFCFPSLSRSLQAIGLSRRLWYCSSLWPLRTQESCSCKGRTSSACVHQSKQFRKYKTSCSLITLFDLFSLSPVKAFPCIFKTLFVLTKADKGKNYSDYVHLRSLNGGWCEGKLWPF